MTFSLVRSWCAGILFALLAPTAVLAQVCAPPATLRFTISEKIVRSAIGFTQGLEFRDGQLYESTGAIGGRSGVNLINLQGEVKNLVDLGTRVFGEGLTIFKDEVFQLTWQEHEVYVYDLAGKLKRTMRNPREGWGLTNDGAQLIFTDGGNALHFADAATFRITKSVRVRSRSGGDVNAVNELEFVDGRIYGNIFTARTIVRIDPASGCVDGIADLGLLWDAMTEAEKRQVAADENNVLNGIAYDKASRRFYLTGKQWGMIFVGRFAE
jgi:glutaminyl-peptide cyclotransferase